MNARTPKVMMPEPEEQPLRWTSLATFLLNVQRSDGGTLIATVQINAMEKDPAKQWMAVAIATSVPLHTVPTATDAFKQVGDDHAHKLIGNYATASDAFAGAESFARAWQRNLKVARFEDCACTEIEEGASR